MPHFTFMFGGLLGIGGLVAYLMDYRLCRQIVDATANRGDGLTHTEVWLNVYSGIKRRKIAEIMRSPHEDPTLRAVARRAFMLSIAWRCLWFAGMILMGFGAMRG